MKKGGASVEALILIGSLVFAILVGYLAVRKLDAFLSAGRFLPEEENEEKRTIT